MFTITATTSSSTQEATVGYHAVDNLEVERLNVERARMALERKKLEAEVERLRRETEQLERQQQQNQLRNSRKLSASCQQLSPDTSFDSSNSSNSVEDSGVTGRMGTMQSELQLRKANLKRVAGYCKCYRVCDSKWRIIAHDFIIIANLCHVLGKTNLGAVGRY